jgi:peptide/nickel transport system permease protein
MKRLLGRYAALCAALVILNFLLPRFLPGDPLDALDAQSTTGGAAMSTLTRTQLRATYHLDAPLGDQFAQYLQDLSRGDLGWSISRSAPVASLIGERLPWTLSLVCVSLFLAASLGVMFGVIAGWLGGSVDRLVITLSACLAALPEFLVAMGLLLGLSVWAGWFPLYGVRSSFGTGDPLDVIWHLMLPALTLVLSTATSFVMLTRGGIRAVLSEPYITVARAKGLSERRVALTYALPNAALPLLSLLGVRVGQVLGGAIVVERVFGVPGLGLLAFDAFRARDYPVLQAVFLLAGGGMVAAGFLAEFASHRLESRHGRH